MLIAVDTNVLIDLAIKSEAVVDSIETLRERLPNVRLVIPPTALHELALAVRRGNEIQRRAALGSLANLREWGFEPLNLVPVGHGIVEQIADTLRRKGLIPMQEKNESLVLSEAGLLGCGILLTSDAHLRGIDFQQLKLLLDDFHVTAPIIATPRENVRKFCR